MDDIPEFWRPEQKVAGSSPTPTLDQDMNLEDIEAITPSQLSTLHLQQEKENVQESGRSSQLSALHLQQERVQESFQLSAGGRRIGWEEKESVEESSRPSSCLSSLSSSSSFTSVVSLRSSLTVSISSIPSGCMSWSSEEEEAVPGRVLRDERRLKFLRDKEPPLSSEAVIQDVLVKRMKRGVRKIFRRVVRLFMCCGCAQTTEEES